MSKRIGIASEMPTMATGFAMQGKILAEEFMLRGYDVYYLGASGSPSEETKYPCLLLNFTDIANLERYHRELNFDWLLFLAPAPFWLGIQNSFVAKECCILFWLPYESVFVDERLTGFFDFLGPGLVHLAYYYNRLWKPYIGARHVIPHAIDTEIFKPLNNKLELRKKWSRKLRYYLGDYVILNLDRNAWRKRWDLTFDVISRLKDSYDITLIAHTSIEPPMKNGGYNLKKLAHDYGIDNNVLFTEMDLRKGFTQEELNELYNIADVRISTSIAEGWGIPTAEAMASGCINVVPNNTTFPEIVENYGFLVDCPNRGYYYGTYGGIIDVLDMVNKIKYVFENDTTALKEKARQKVEQEYNKSVIGEKFDIYIKELESEDYKRTRVIKYEKFLPRRIDNFKKYVAFGKIVGKMEKTVDFLDVTHGFDIFGASLLTKVRGRTSYKEMIYEGVLPFVIEEDIGNFNCLCEVAVVSHLFENIQDFTIKQIIDRSNYKWIFMEIEEDVFLSKARNFKTNKHWEKFMLELGYIEQPDFEILIKEKAGLRIKVFKHKEAEDIDLANLTKEDEMKITGNNQEEENNQKIIENNQTVENKQIIENNQEEKALLSSNIKAGGNKNEDS